MQTKNNLTLIRLWHILNVNGMENAGTQSDADLVYYIYKATADRNNSHENSAYHQTNHCYVIQFGFPVFVDFKFFIW